MPVTLELGGKSPQIVFDDADLDRAIPVLVGACMQNAGQTCSAASRVLVQAGVYDEVRRRMSDIFNGLVAGPAPTATTWVRWCRRARGDWCRISSILAPAN